MKLLKKLLPFATIGSMAAIGLSTLTSCNTNPLENEVTVTFNLDEGHIEGLEGNTMKVVKGTTYGQLPTPKKDGCVFDHWKGVSLTNKIKEDVTAIAIWVVAPEPVETWNVFFNLQPGETIEGLSADKKMKVEKGTTYGMLPKPTKESSDKKHYFFAGWKVGDTNVQFTDTIPSNVSVVARWSETPVLYQVTFHLNGGTIPGISEGGKMSIEQGSRYGMLPIPTKTDVEHAISCKFVGWKETPSSKIIINPNREITGNATVYAVWEEPEDSVWRININNPDIEPEEWQELYSPQVSGDEPRSGEYTRQYFAAAKKDKNILAGDIACSYYSSVFTSNSELTQNLQEIDITIKDIDAEHCTASFIVEDVPKAGASPEYHTITEINNFPYVARYIVIPEETNYLWDGYAVEPLPLIIFANVYANLIDLGLSEDEALEGAQYAECEYLALYGGWSAKITTHNSSGEPKTLSWDFNSEIGDKNPTNPTTLFYFTTNYIHSWDLSLRSHYLETWNEE